MIEISDDAKFLTPLIRITYHSKKCFSYNNLVSLLIQIKVIGLVALVRYILGIY